MIGDAIQYPMNDDEWIKNTAIGGVLVLLGSFLLLPIIPAQGYFLRVTRGAALGNETPPKFRDWEGLVIDGLKMMAVTLIYGMGIFLAMGVLLFAGLAGVLGFGAIGGEGAGLLAGGVLSIVGILVAIALGLVITYITPAAVANMAVEDSIGAAFDFSTISDVATSVDYLVAVVLAAVVGGVIGSVGGALMFLIVGIPILFYGQVVTWYLVGRGFGDAGGATRQSTTPRSGTRTETATNDRKWD